MSSVYRDTTVTLTLEERAKLKEALEICSSIARNCNDDGMWMDASTVFACVYDKYKDGEVPACVELYE